MYVLRDNIVVLYNVALYSKYLKQCFVILIVAYWYYCRFLSLWCYTMLHCTLSNSSNILPYTLWQYFTDATKMYKNNSETLIPNSRITWSLRY